MTQYLNDAVNSISESIRIDSSLARPQAGMPFGKGAFECLNHFLSLASEMGFETKNYDNYIGEVIFGAGDDFAILCHLDVVPAGTGWKVPPFEGLVSDGKIWGRGATDDKGPAFAALYALKMLKDEGFVPHKTIKLIVGCNEECGWKCIEYYETVNRLPEVGFSPDANFPVIYAEKGILQVRLHYPVKSGLFTYMNGGERANMVCDSCGVRPVTVDRQKSRKLKLSFENGKFVYHGKSAHASTPEEGDNAILPILTMFREDESVLRVIEDLFEDKKGLTQLADETGNLTLSPDMIHYRKGFLAVVCDIRYPATMTLAQVMEAVDRFGVKYEVIHHQSPIYNDKNGPLISTLRSVFEEYTDQKCEPIAIGGGTYARALKNGAAFGPEIAGDVPVAHQPNEFITIDRIELMMNVYKEAIKRLTR